MKSFFKYLLAATLSIAVFGSSQAQIHTNYGNSGITNLTGDVTSVGSATTVVGINNTNLSGLSTGLLKNTTGTGVPSIAVPGTDYLTPTGSGAGLTNIPYSAITNVPTTNWAWRGIGQAMSPTIQGYNVGNGISQTIRSRHYSNVRFRQIEVVLQTYAPLLVGSVITDTPHPFGLQWQVGFELNYSNSVSGITPRNLFTFSGSPIATYAMFTSVTISQNSSTGTYTNILGNFAAGQNLFCGVTSIGIIQSATGGTVTLNAPYSGPALTSTNCTTNNGSTQQAGIIVSDPMDIGSYYTPGTISSPNFFGLHTTVENPTQTILNGATFTTGTNTLTFTSSSGPFGIGYPVYLPISGVQTLIGTVASGSGNSWILASTYGTTITSQTGYSQGLPYQRSSSNFLQKYIAGVASTTLASTTSATATASSTVTLAGTSSGWAIGMGFQATSGTVPNGTYVTALGTSTGGNGTIILNNAVTVSAAAASGAQSNTFLDIARSNAIYTSETLNPQGVANYFTPCMARIYTNSSLPFVNSLGDSIEFGVGEGVESGSFNGTISGNVLTVNSGFSGSALVAGMSIYGASNSVIGTLGSNISGSGNGSTWNITASNVGPINMYYTVTGLTGDSLGSSLGNSGFVERGVNELLGYPMTNLSRGSDAFYMLAASNGINWQYRQQYLQAANPTHIISGNIHNDISNKYNTAVSGWTATTGYTVGSVVAGTSNISDYLLTGTNNGTNTCISSTTILSTTVYGNNISDGSCIWQYLFPHITTSNSRGATISVGNAYVVLKKIKQLLPGTNIIQQASTIDAGSTDLYVTTTNQTPTADGWGTVAASGTATTSGSSTTVTISGGTNWAIGFSMSGIGIPNGTFVQSLGTYSAGSGTLILNQPINVSSLSVTGSLSTHSEVNSLFNFSTTQNLLGINTVFDTNSLMESGGAGASGKFIVNGNIYYVTIDGTHYNSEGSFLAEQIMTNSLFPSNY